MSAPRRFVADIKGIRQRARQQLGDGAVTNNYGGKVEDAIALLNRAVATEIMCVLRYKSHAVCASGLASEAVQEEFPQHAREEVEIWTFSPRESISSEASPTSTPMASVAALRRSTSRATTWST